MKSEVNGTSLEVFENGSGKSVLFVHGSNADYRTWQAQQGEFASSYRTITYSRRFHYPNEPITEGEDYSMSQHLDDLQAFIQSHIDKPVHLVGHSYGAFLSLLLAIRGTQHLRSLVLEEPPIFTLFMTIPPKPQDILRLLITRPRTAMAIIRFATSGLNPAVSAAQNNDMDESLRVFGSAILGKEFYDSMSPERLEQARLNNFREELLGTGFLPLDAGEISKINIPTLLINGEKSPSLFHHFITRLHELIPNAEHVTIPSASHIAHEDNPSAYNRVVSNFLNQVS